MIILNLKNYAESTGKNLFPVISAIEEAIAEVPLLGEILSIAPAIYDLHAAAQQSKSLRVIAQHVDNKGIGSTTGWAPAAAIKELGIEYSVLNHSEHRFSDWQELEATITNAQTTGVKLIVCCENLSEAEKLLPLSPFAIAYEDKDLIGSGESITTGRPEEVQNFVALVQGKAKAIIGAGISTAEDIKVGKEFGAEGFILASAFVKANDRKAKALELGQAFLN